MIANKLFFITCMVFLAAMAGIATAQQQQQKQQVYRCGDRWSYYPCPPQESATPVTNKPTTPELLDPLVIGLNEGEEGLEKMKLLERLNNKIKSIEETHKVVPNHAYKTEALCKNPDISIATCARLISELEESMKYYDREQILAELERREEREMDERKRLSLRAERLRMLRTMPKDGGVKKKQDIDKF